MQIKHIAKAAFIATILAMGTAAHAGVMGFETYVSTTSYTESGMAMTKSGSLGYASFVANRMAHIDSGYANFVLANGNDFTLNSVGLYGYDNTTQVRFEAYDNGAFKGAFVTNTTTNTLVTANLGSLFQGIDQFRIVYGNNHFNFDNVTFNAAAVPEPGSLALLAIGVAGLVARRRRPAA